MMKRSENKVRSSVFGGSARGVAVLCTLTAILWLQPVMAADIPVDIRERWDTPGDLAGWTGSNSKATLSNPGGYMDMAFEKQGMLEAESCIARHDVDPGIQLERLTFRFLAPAVAPSAVRIYVHSMSGKAWYVNLRRFKVGRLVEYSVLVTKYSQGWTIGPAGTEAQFKSDMLDVDWVGVYVRRGGSGLAHNFQIDNFRLRGWMDSGDTDNDRIPDEWELANGLDINDPSDAREDGDGDGMTNYQEYRAGTDPNDPDSVLALELDLPDQTDGIIVKWNSVAFRTYSILRSTNLLIGFDPLYSGIPATPPINSYDDHTATGAGPYFYKVEVESGE